jgi:hemerythrin-like domain-containing protein
MSLSVSCTLSAAMVFATVALASAQTPAPTLAIPKALQAEHHDLFESLEAATKSGGKTGEAAKRAMAVLKPHFEKEERFALPQLGALETLTRKGAAVPAGLREDLIRRTDSFRAELDGMLAEHKQISAALKDMREAAAQEKKDDVAELAEMITGHAEMEEQVLYPAALLVGEYARAMSGVTGSTP